MALVQASQQTHEDLCSSSYVRIATNPHINLVSTLSMYAVLTDNRVIYRISGNIQLMSLSVIGISKPN